MQIKLLSANKKPSSESAAVTPDPNKVCYLTFDDGPSYVTPQVLAILKDKYGIEARAIVNMSEVTECLYNNPIDGNVIIDDNIKGALDAYYREYGVK